MAIQQIGEKAFVCTIAEAVELLEILTDGGDEVMLWGTYGIGKSSIVKQLAKRRDVPLIDFRTNIREPVDMRGIPVADLEKNTTRWLPPNELPRVERDGPKGYFFADEINTNQQMMPVMMQLVLDHQVGDYHFPHEDGWRIIAAGNHISDRAAAVKMPTALRNRFAHIYIVPDVKAWRKWAIESGLPAELVAFIAFRPELLHVPPQGDEGSFPTPRSWEKAGKYVDAPRHLRAQLFAAHVGKAAASEFDAFLDLYRSIGSLDGIIADPDGAPVPTDPSVRYATCVGLARSATRQNLANIVKFTRRLSREFEVLTVMDATTRDPKLKDTSAYGRWAVDNADITAQAA